MTLPAGVTEIGDAAFAGCSHLRKLILPAGVAAIGAGAFAGVQEIVSESAKFPVDGSGILMILKAGMISSKAKNLIRHGWKLYPVLYHTMQ